MDILKRKIARFLAMLLMRIHHKSYSMLGRFACIAEGGLHPKHRLMDYHKFFVDNINESDYVLDLGCGNGALTLDLSKKAQFVVGMDINAENIAICKSIRGRDNIKYLVGDINKDLPKERFNAAVLSNVLEHIDDRRALLRNLYCIAGRLVVRIPMLDRDWVTLYKKELGTPYLLDPTHKIEYTLETFKDEVIQAGFKIVNYSVRFGEIWAVCAKSADAPQL